MAKVTITIEDLPRDLGMKGQQVHTSIESDPDFPGSISKPTVEFTLAQLVALKAFRETNQLLGEHADKNDRN